MVSDVTGALQLNRVVVSPHVGRVTLLSSANYKQGHPSIYLQFYIQGHHSIYSSTYRVISISTILLAGSSLYWQLYIQGRQSAGRRDVSTFHWIYRFLVVSSEFLLTRLNELWKKNLVFPAVKGILQWNVASANTYYGCCYQGCNKPKLWTSFCKTMTLDIFCFNSLRSHNFAAGIVSLFRQFYEPQPRYYCSSSLPTVILQRHRFESPPQKKITWSEKLDMFKIVRYFKLDLNIDLERFWLFNVFSN